MSFRTGRWQVPLLLATTTTLLTLALVGAVGEWAVRHRERTRSSPPGTMSKLFYRHSRLMHGLERGTDYYGWVHMDRQGFRRAQDVSVSPPDSVYRIIAVGSSTTFDGNTSGDSSAWSARLEQILDSVAAPRRFEVLNAGVPGFEVFDDLVRLQLELYRYRPDLIILYEGHNDLFNTLAHAGWTEDREFDRRPGEIPTVYPWEAWLEHHSLLYHKLRSRVQAIRSRSSGAERLTRATAVDYQRVVDDGLKNYARNLQLFLVTARSLGIHVVIPQLVYTADTDAEHGADTLITALQARAIPFAPPSVVWASYARYDSVARSVAFSTGAQHIPASDRSLWLIDGYSEGDPIHFNDLGAWRMARHLAAAIQALPEFERYHAHRSE